jgi:hypothetical protein
MVLRYITPKKIKIRIDMGSNIPSATKLKPRNPVT